MQAIIFLKRNQGNFFFTIGMGNNEHNYFFIGILVLACASNWAVASWIASSALMSNSLIFSWTTSSYVSCVITRTMFIASERVHTTLFIYNISFNTKNLIYHRIRQITQIKQSKFSKHLAVTFKRQMEKQFNWGETKRLVALHLRSRSFDSSIAK